MVKLQDDVLTFPTTTTAIAMMVTLQDDDLPWDPLWAYVLGEDDEGRDQVPEKRLSLDFGYRDESRDAGDGAGITRACWPQRRETASSSNRALVRESWQWELDTSSFRMVPERHESYEQHKSYEQHNIAKLACGWRKGHDKGSQNKKPWIGAIWKDRTNPLRYKLLKS
jgi:hypothetical protein